MNNRREFAYGYIRGGAISGTLLAVVMPFVNASLAHPQPAHTMYWFEAYAILQTLMCLLMMSDLRPKT